MSFLQRIDFGWIYLLCGLALTMSAIVLPAHQELASLQAKRAELLEDFSDVEHRVRIYDDFLQDIRKNDPFVRQKIINMQYNIAGNHEVVVIDTFAMQTPLKWLAKRAQRKRIVQFEKEQASLLSSLSNGNTRFVLLGIGLFAMFIGFTKKVPIIDRT